MSGAYATWTRSSGAGRDLLTCVNKRVIGRRIIEALALRDRAAIPRYLAFERDNKLRAQQLRSGMYLGGSVFMEDGLRHTLAVAQMDKDDASEVAAAMHPAHDKRALARIRSSQPTAGMRPAQVAKKIKWYVLLHVLSVFEPHDKLLEIDGLLLPGGEILHCVRSGGDLIVADDQSVTGLLFAGSLQRSLQLGIRAELG